MTLRSILYGTMLVSVLALTACTQGDSGDKKSEGSSGKNGGEQAGQVVGYYTYSDPARGSFSLALLEKNRFLLVTESAPGVPRGAVGWYALRDDTIHLSSEGLDAQGRVDGDILQLRFGAGDPRPEAEETTDDEGLPFQREDGSAKKGGKQNQGGSSDKSSDSSKKSSGK